MKKGILKLYGFLLVVALIFISSCNQSNKADDFEGKVKETAQDYFKTFAERNDWNKFCSFYSEDVRFKDIILQLDLDSLWKLKRFYKWNDDGDKFKKLSPEQEHLTIKSLVVNGNIAVVKGHLNPFYYDGHLIDTDWGMEFTIWLHFDENLKIIEQNDWLEYDSYTLEATIKRCRENGFETIPDWLDLSKKE